MTADLFPKVFRIPFVTLSITSSYLSGNVKRKVSNHVLCGGQSLGARGSVSHGQQLQPYLSAAQPLPTPSLYRPSQERNT